MSATFWGLIWDKIGRNRVRDRERSGSSGIERAGGLKLKSRVKCCYCRICAYSKKDARTDPGVEGALLLWATDAEDVSQGETKALRATLYAAMEEETAGCCGRSGKSSGDSRKRGNQNQLICFKKSATINFYQRKTEENGKNCLSRGKEAWTLMLVAHVSSNSSGNKYSRN